MPEQGRPGAAGETAGRAAREARLGSFLHALRAAGRELDPHELLDVLWLAGRLPAGDGADPAASRLPLPRALRLHATPPGPVPGPAHPPDAEDGRDETPDGPGEDAGAPAVPPGGERARPELYAAAPPRADAPRPRHTAPPADGFGPPPDKPVVPLRAPQEKALREELRVGRALRPLKRKRPSARHREFDEQATAAALAETGLPDVATRPVRERWLHLALVLDDGMTMLLWQRLAAELRTVLQRLGAFRSVRVHGLHTRTTGRPLLHGRPFESGPSRGPAMSPSVLTDPSAQTLVVTVSDGMGAAWRTGRMHDVLQEWAEAGPAVVVHTLPPELWEASGIQADGWRATTRTPGGANTSWEVSDPVLPAGLVPFTGVPVPVLEPSAGALGTWARLLASTGTTVELPLLARPRHDTPDGPPRAADGLQHFRDAATPAAYRLAAHLAAVSPVSVPVMRLVQSAVPWPARTAHLAEVFLGGLMHPLPAPVPGPLPARHRIFDFPEETKSALLDALPSAELLRTGRRIGRRLEQLAGRSPDFPAWLAHPEGAETLPESFRAFTAVERRLMARFGVTPEREADVAAAASSTAAAAPAGDGLPGTAGWEPLTPQDPRLLGPYTLLGRRAGRHTVVYRAQAMGAFRSAAETGTVVAVRALRPDAPRSLTWQLRTEAEALGRLAGRYAPQLLEHSTAGEYPWLAMSLIPHAQRPDWPPARLRDALADGQLDILTSLVLAWHVASALALCHLKGLVPRDLSTDWILLHGRSISLNCLLHCAVDGEYPGGRAPTEADSIVALGEVLSEISGRHRAETSAAPARFEPLGLWQGDTWEPLRELVERCRSTDPAERPSANEVAGALARYVSLAAAATGQDDPLPGSRPAPPPELPPLPPSVREAGTADERALGRRTVRSRFGELARIRRPLERSHRVTVVGAHPHAGRLTTTFVLGTVLAAVRGTPVLALDASPTHGALRDRLSRRNPASLREVAGLALETPLEELRRFVTATPAGLDVLAHASAQTTRGPGWTEELHRVLALAGRHYPVVLSDWGAPHLDRSASPLLGWTDHLVVCCEESTPHLDDAGELLEKVRDMGHGQLADRATLAFARPSSEGPLATQRYSGHPGDLVLVPSDQQLAAHREVDLARLRTATKRRFLELAAAAMESPAGTAPPDGDPRPEGRAHT
ncbi:SAV_2336 N-terminal domain-related protein [Streptomyces cacaoi]|uniref:SAV_2336 N-terminal domain-related protein n=1 Tax=Streptomyces cacaoi TaxID=1898 RepID=UPI00332C3CF2